AAPSPAVEITQIVGNGQQNKGETVLLNTTTLNSIYGANPPFPGEYNGSWDNPTWFSSVAVKSNDFTATSSVTPTATNSGCVSWGAIVFSTPVQDSDNDGLLDVWKQNQGYRDVNTGQFVALPGAKMGEKDIFVELDWLTNLDQSDGNNSYKHSHLPKQQALDMVGQAFANQGIHIHFDVGNTYQTNPPDPYIISYNPNSPYGGNAISEGLFLCNDATSNTPCPFPGIPAVSWKGAVDYIRNNANTCAGITTGCTPQALGNFEYGRKDSYHYVLFGHALGYPASYWGTVGTAPAINGDPVPTLVSIAVNNNVGVVTLLTPAPSANPSEVVKPGDASCAQPPYSYANCDRVTVEGALNPVDAALNGTYKFLSAPIQSGPDNTTHMWTTTFTIQTSGVLNGTYNYTNEPQLGIAYGGPSSTSGHSDVGGADTAVTFGLWPADDAPGCQPDPSLSIAPGQSYCTNQVGTITAEAGTLMHELGHSLGLTHGGTYYPNSSLSVNGVQENDLAHATSTSYPYYDWNCKPNYLSVMNYLFQIRGFPDNGGIDYSGQTLQDLDETKLSETAGIGSDNFTTQPASHWTRWYAPPDSLDTMLQNTIGGRYATVTCDGVPIPAGTENMVRVNGSGPYIDWDNDAEVGEASDEPSITQDVDLNLETSDTALHGFNDWANLDLRQIGARGNTFGSSDGIISTYGGGIISTYGGGAEVNSEL
ncbi:MAG: hypothetical protein KGL02_13450, partial [Acidobacteriota bacterium]|nr:hypothetical protein [Acidobacteriota bacterium]